MRICSVENCNKKHIANGYCNKHYTQIYNYGKILERTIYDPNEFIIDGDICWVILYDIKCIETARAKFYTKYYKQIKESDLKWSLDSHGYAVTKWNDENDQRQYILLHQAIIQLSGQIVQPGEEIDHKDGNKLNCLDDNLRICSTAQNQQNRIILSNNTSGWKGVSWSKSNKKWQAQITNNNIKEPLGSFDTIEDAARAYNVAAIKYHGEFAVLNNI